MKYEAKTPGEYISQLPEEQKEAFIKLKTVIVENLPEGFEETMIYGMIGYVVPHSIYPQGYHVDSNIPLPFINLGAQKHFIALYHMGIYAKSDLLDWFVAAYPKHSKTKLDMGKSCIRLKNMNALPYELIAQLVQKMSVQEWISLYEQSRPK